MHVLELYMECGGYDYRLIKGGISVYLWNLAKSMAAEGATVSVVTAMHGQQDYLTGEHGMVKLNYDHRWDMEIDADPKLWGDGQPLCFPLQTSAYLIKKDGVDLYLLSNEFLDRYPDSYYPPYESKGKDHGFFKSLVFQMEAIFFIRRQFAGQTLVVHAHEPYYQYLIPAAFREDPTKKVVSTVQSNMPINKKVYLPKVRSLFRQLGVEIDLSRFADQLPRSTFNRCLLDYLPRTHLNYPYPGNYLNLFALVVEDSDLVDFLSEGHREFYTRFVGTPFRALYRQLGISTQMERQAAKFFVGGCALSNSWLTADFTQFDRQATLAELGLDPALPTFFHNARYAPNHKGQVELVQAIHRVLGQGLKCNFILRCVSGTGIEDTRFHQLRQRYPDQVALIWQMQEERALMAMASASDFAIFPSKFEMDTFLIAQGEAMLAGCVPVAAEQLGMKHWCHSPRFSKEGEATGFAVVRSFLEEDELLIRSLVTAIGSALELYADTHRFEEKSQAAQIHARQFSWEKVARTHLEVFSQGAPAGGGAEIPENAQHWLNTAVDQGQLIDARRQDEDSGFPDFSVDVSLAEYRLEEASTVTLFLENGCGFSEIPLQSAEDSCFRASLQEQNERALQPIFLVTLKDGFQFWDGAIEGGMAGG